MKAMSRLANRKLRTGAYVKSAESRGFAWHLARLIPDAARREAAVRELLRRVR